MPYLSWNQIHDQEYEFADLLEQLKEETERANAAERELREIRTRNPDVI